MKDICRESDRCLLLLRMYACGNNHHGFLISCAESWKRSERDMGGSNRDRLERRGRENVWISGEYTAARTRVLDPGDGSGAAAFKGISGKREPSGVRGGGFAVSGRDGDGKGRSVCEKLRGRTFIFGGGWKPVYCETMVCGPGM